MIGDNHEGTGSESAIKTAGRIGDQQISRPEQGENPQRKGDLPGGVALVVMKAALQHGHLLTGQLPADQAPGMAGDRGTRKIRDLLIIKGRALFNVMGQGAEAGAQDNDDIRGNRQPFFKKVNGLLHLLAVKACTGGHLFILLVSLVLILFLGRESRAMPPPAKREKTMLTARGRPDHRPGQKPFQSAEKAP